MDYVDGIDHVALVAITVDDPRTIVGVARFVRRRGDPDDDPELGELAIVVGDELQHQGLGSELLRQLSSCAVAVGVRRLRATMLAENTPAHRLVRGAAAGREIRERPGGYLYELEIELPGPDHELDLSQADHELDLSRADHGFEPAA